MKYKLREEDYRKLWLVMTPEDIEEEFGIHSHSARQIRKFYEGFGLQKLHKARKELMESLPNTDEFSTDEALHSVIEEERNNSIRELWNKIRDYNQEWDFTS